MDNEIWKKVKDFNNYEISNLGNLRSVDRKVLLKSRNQFTIFKAYKNIKGKEIKKAINEKGYYQVSLYKNGKRFNKVIHRLVAEAFIENPFNKPTVNHKNGNKLDNRVDNLEWATNKEQIEHLNKVLNHKSVISDKCRKRQIELHQKKVIRDDGVIFNSIKEASDGDNSLRNRITLCCKGKIKTAGGYRWEYI